MKAAAQRRRAEEVLEGRLRVLLARMEVPPVDDPLGELTRLAGQVLAWRDVCAEQVNTLTSIRYTAGGAGTEQLRAEVALFERALDRCASVLVAIARLDIDSRLARISERQAEVIIGAIDAALATAGVVGPAAQDARRVAARELRAVQ